MYGLENLGGFVIFFLKKPKQIDKPPKPLPEYAPAQTKTTHESSFLTVELSPVKEKKD